MSDPEIERLRQTNQLGTSGQSTRDYAQFNPQPFHKPHTTSWPVQNAQPHQTTARSNGGYIPSGGYGGGYSGSSGWFGRFIFIVICIIIGLAVFGENSKDKAVSTTKVPTNKYDKFVEDANRLLGYYKNKPLEYSNKTIREISYNPTSNTLVLSVSGINMNLYGIVPNTRSGIRFEDSPEFTKFRDKIYQFNAFLVIAHPG